MEDREKDIQELCDQVLNIIPNTRFNMYSWDTTTCPLCQEFVNWADANMEEIKHNLNCGYLIAKDLTTNINK